MRLYQILAQLLGIALKDSDFIQREKVSPETLKAENPELADRILRNAKAYELIMPQVDP